MHSVANALKVKCTQQPIISGFYCCCSVIQSSPTLCNPKDCSISAFLSFTISWSLFNLKSIESVMPSNHLVLYHPILLLQSFPEPECFPMSWLFISASASVSPVTFQDWFPLGLTGLISLQPKWLTRGFSKNSVQKYQFLNAQPPLWPNLHLHMTTKKTTKTKQTNKQTKHSSDSMELCWQRNVLLF